MLTSEQLNHRTRFVVVLLNLQLNVNVAKVEPWKMNVGAVIVVLEAEISRYWDCIGEIDVTGQNVSTSRARPEAAEVYSSQAMSGEPPVK